MQIEKEDLHNALNHYVKEEFGSHFKLKEFHIKKLRNKGDRDEYIIDLTVDNSKNKIKD